MASLSQREGQYHVRFRYRGKAYRRSLKTDDRKMAQSGLHQVQLILARLEQGTMAIPHGVDTGDFIVSGGTRDKPVEVLRPKTPSLREAMETYLARLEHLAPSHRDTKRVHLNNLVKHLGKKADAPIAGITYGLLDGFIQSRLKSRKQETVKKDRDTIIDFFRWASLSGFLTANPAQNLPIVKSGRNEDPFRTVVEIEETIRRGGLTDLEAKSLWKSLYLTEDEIREVLDRVSSKSGRGVPYLLHAIAAYTGMRRGEILRLRWTDIDFVQSAVTARSLKQSRHTTEVVRRIDLHPELLDILRRHRESTKRGQYVIFAADTLAPISKKLSLTLFRQPLRRSRWCLDSKRNHFMIGFHTYRHSFASNLAAKGIDQRIIDEWMGHTTEAMRKRYRHLFPNQKRAAIQVLSFQGFAPDTT